MEIEWFQVIIAAIAGFIIGVFVYRNNVDMLSPIAGKIDVKFDELKLEIQELKRKLEDKYNV